MLQHAGAIKDVFTMKEVRLCPPATRFISFHLPSCNCAALPPPAGDVLPGPVHHPEAAVRSEAAAHCPLLPRRAGPGAGSGQLLRQRAAVRRQSHPSSPSRSHTGLNNPPCFCFRVLFATIMKNLVAVKNPGENILFSLCSSELQSSSQTCGS